MLIPIETLEIVKDKTISLDSPLIRAGVQQLKNKKMIKLENHESIIELPELLLEIWNIAQEADKRNGNKNAEEKQ
jgi:hypothetical protein